MHILIEGLELYAYHGVLPEEKSLGQPFVFDLELNLDDDLQGTETDSVEDTVNYAEVVEVVREVATGQSFNLLEKLAAEVGKAVLGRFPRLYGLHVTVKKPHPPISARLGGVGVVYSAWRDEREGESPDEPPDSLAYLGLGSNEDEPQTQLAGAVAAIGRLEGTRLVQISSLYRTAPVGVEEQADFLNQVVGVRTQLPPRYLLQALHALESAAGRVRTVKWGPRPLDIDLLWFDGWRIDDPPDLEVPHPRLEERRFVLEPLAEIAPGLVLPSGRTVEEALERVLEQRVERLKGDRPPA